MSMPNTLDGGGYIRVLWWIITVLSGCLAGAGSNWITQIDKQARIEAKIEVILQSQGDLSKAVGNMERRLDRFADDHRKDKP